MTNKAGLWVVLFTSLFFLNWSQKDDKRQRNTGDDTNYEQGMDTIDAMQLVVITSNGWNEVQGKMRCYEKKDHRWTLAFSCPVVVGVHGMGVGAGIKAFDLPGAPLKKEGDLKAPAGFFNIGTAFGYAAKREVTWLKVPYLEATDALLCIDDGRSSRYNQLVYSDKLKKDWTSSEVMHRTDNMYKWGLLVEHNYSDPAPGKGSCIFIHIWKSGIKGTAGCSAMQEADLLKLLRWIDSSKKPVLVQFPKKAYDDIAKRIYLPVI